MRVFVNPLSMSIREKEHPDLYRTIQEQNLLRQYDLLANCIEIGLTWRRHTVAEYPAKPAMLISSSLYEAMFGSGSGSRQRLFRKHRPTCPQSSTPGICRNVTVCGHCFRTLR
jgi:hypothetical protein